MVSGVEGALDARRRQIEREAKKQTLHSRGKEPGSGRVAAEKNKNGKRVSHNYRAIEGLGHVE